MIRPHPSRGTAILVAVVAALALVTGCGVTSTPAHPASSPREVTISISLHNGVVTPQKDQISVPTGTTVDFLVTSDHADEVDVSHGPDLQVGAGQTIHGTFIAKKAGSDEIWSSRPPVLIATLTVS